SNNGTAAMRSIASIQASSLASMMHVNRNFWSTVADGFSFSFAGSGTPTSTVTALAGTAPNCTSSTCTAVQVATLDLSTWRTNVIGVLPFPTGTITCSNVS